MIDEKGIQLVTFQIHTGQGYLEIGSVDVRRPPSEDETRAIWCHNEQQNTHN